MTTRIEATRSLEQQAEFLRQSGDKAGAMRLLEQVRQVWQACDPVTTYVRLRRARSERLLAALRLGAPLR